MKTSVVSLRKVSGIIPESVADLTGIRNLGLWEQGVRVAPARAPPELAESACRELVESVMM